MTEKVVGLVETLVTEHRESAVLVAAIISSSAGLAATATATTSASGAPRAARRSSRTPSIEPTFVCGCDGSGRPVAS